MRTPDFQLGDWLVQPALCRLSRAEQVVRVRPKVMDLLVFLAEHPGRVLSKEDLLNGVWATEAISESSLTRSMTELRQALDDSAQDPRIIETIPKRGYRLLLAPVNTPESTEHSSPLSAKRPRSVAWWRIAAMAALGTAIAALTVTRSGHETLPRQTGEVLATSPHVTTKSPRALAAYAMAAALMPNHNEAARPHLQDALRFDPDFASARILLAWAIFNSGGAPDEYLPLAREAVRFSSGVGEAEREFIAGSLNWFQWVVARDPSSREQNLRAAIDRFEATLKAEPDHIWALHNLYELFRAVGERGNAARISKRLAAVRPDLMSAQVEAAQIVLEEEGLEQARPYITRALMLPPVARTLDDVSADQPTYAQLFVVHDLWAQRRAREAAAQLDKIVASRVLPDVDRTWLRVGGLRLALGQLSLAEQSYSRIVDIGFRNLGFAELALARNETHTIRDRFELQPTQDLAAVSLLVRAGALNEARKVLQTMPGVLPAHLQWAEQEISEAEGKVELIQRALSNGVPWLRAMDGVRIFLYTETLARSAAQIGRIDDAIRALGETAGLGERTYPPVGHTGYFWMRNQLLLSDLHRARGTVAQAQAIEQDLRLALEMADGGHPMRLVLGSR